MEKNTSLPNGGYEFSAEGLTVTVMTGFPDFSVSETSKGRVSPNEVHTHSWYELFYVKAGELHFTDNGGKRTVHAGEIILVPPGYEHYTDFYGLPENRFVYNFYVDYTEETVTSVKIRNLLYTDKPIWLAADSELKITSENLSLSLSAGHGIAAGCRLLLMLLRITHLMQSENAVHEILSDNGISRVYKLEQIISHYYRQNLPLSEVAKALHLSERQLSRFVKQTYGCGYRVHIQKLRMNAAAALLKEGKSVSETASAVGYDSLSGFVGAFKQVYGVPPLTYKNKEK